MQSKSFQQVEGNKDCWVPGLYFAAVSAGDTLPSRRRGVFAFETPDSASRLHNRPPLTSTSNTRLRHWLPGNAAANDRDVWCGAAGGRGFKKTHNTFVAAAAGRAYLRVGTSSARQPLNSRAAGGFSLRFLFFVFYRDARQRPS